MWYEESLVTPLYPSHDLALICTSQSLSQQTDLSHVCSPHRVSQIGNRYSYLSLPLHSRPHSVYLYLIVLGHHSERFIFLSHLFSLFETVLILRAIGGRLTARLTRHITQFFLLQHAFSSWGGAARPLGCRRKLRDNR